MHRRSFLTFTLIGLIGCKSPSPTVPPDEITPPDSLNTLQNIAKTPEDCQTCHPNHFAEWQASMHNYAFVDPIFFKLNALGQERSAGKLDQFCISCHSPFASALGEAPPDFQFQNLSSLARQGVGCDVCHMMKSSTRGRGIDEFHLDGARRGPLQNPQENAFHASVFDRNFLLSGVCSGCHDVLGPDGFKLENTSSEWDASEYAIMAIECQDCHMPTYSGRAATDGPLRDNLHRHNFIGVDVPLVDFPGRAQTIEKVGALLKNAATLEVEAPGAIHRDEEFAIKATIINDFTGHNLPSGTIFERQMWLEVVLHDAASGDTLMASGTLDDNGDLRDHHSEFVTSRAAELDSSLTVFRGTAFRNGQETLFFWEADSIADETIPAFQSRTAEYRFKDLPEHGQQLRLSVRLLFRAFPPYLLRAIDENELISELPIFEMEVFSATIQVEN